MPRDSTTKWNTMPDSEKQTTSNWIFLSKNGDDEYINQFAQGSGAAPTNTDDFDYDGSRDPIVLRGILKYKIMHRCRADRRDFYYMDTGYFGNNISDRNPYGWKLWHRIVKNDLQHGDIVRRPATRWRRLGIDLQPRRQGRSIIVAAPDEKPCRFYGIDRDTWIKDTVARLQELTDRPVILRERSVSRKDRIKLDPLDQVLANGVHALVTYNSNAATESIIQGVPAFVLAPSHAARPVANTDLQHIDDPWWPDDSLRKAWVNHLAYGQFHVDELRDGTAYRILNED
jgi:hypothetical protein